MKETYLDTNVFMRFFIDDFASKSQKQKIKSLYKKIIDKKKVVRTNILVLAETCYVMKRQYKYQNAKIAEKLLPLLTKCSNIKLEEKKEAIKALRIYSEKNIDFEDAYIYTDMLSRNIDSIYTFDKKHFNKLKGVKIKK
jgi:predicted nucleic acid-binding protein